MKIVDLVYSPLRTGGVVRVRVRDGQALIYVPGSTEPIVVLEGETIDMETKVNAVAAEIPLRFIASRVSDHEQKALNDDG